VGASPEGGERGALLARASAGVAGAETKGRGGAGLERGDGADTAPVAEGATWADTAPEAGGATGGRLSRGSVVGGEKGVGKGVGAGTEVEVTGGRDGRTPEGTGVTVGRMGGNVMVDG
jgi:hypothetical protein